MGRLGSFGDLLHQIAYEAQQMLWVMKLVGAQCQVGWWHGLVCWQITSVCKDCRARVICASSGHSAARLLAVSHIAADFQGSRARRNEARISLEPTWLRNGKVGGCNAVGAPTFAIMELLMSALHACRRPVRTGGWASTMDTALRGAAAGAGGGRTPANAPRATMTKPVCTGEPGRHTTKPNALRESCCNSWPFMGWMPIGCRPRGVARSRPAIGSNGNLCEHGRLGLGTMVPSAPDVGTATALEIAGHIPLVSRGTGDWRALESSAQRGYIFQRLCAGRQDCRAQPATRARAEQSASQQRHTPSMLDHRRHTLLS